MIRAWLESRFGRQPAKSGATIAPAVTVAVVPPHASRQPGVPIYPPKDGGIAIVSSAEMVATKAPLIEMLRKHVALPEEQFVRRYLGPIHRLADFVGLLPASRADHHSGAGGLFTLALEMGVHAARTADGVIFAKDEAFEKKRDAETAWRHAAFLTALCTELYRPLVGMRVVAEGEVWGPYISGLNRWAKSVGATQVHVRWLEKQAEPSGVKAAAGYAINAIAGEELLNALHQVNPTIVHVMVGTATGTMTALDDHPLQRVISSVRKRLIDIDRAQAPTLYGNLTQGAHLEPHLLDAMRQLIANGTWKVNEKGARLHYGRDGLHLAWPIGAKELLTHLRAARVDGVPENPVTLGELLVAGGVLEAGPGGQPWHSIFPANASDTSREKIVAVRFRLPQSILPPDAPVEAVDWKLAAGPPSSGATNAKGADPEPSEAAEPAAVASLATPAEGVAAETAPDQARKRGRRTPKPPEAASGDAEQLPTVAPVEAGVMVEATQLDLVPDGAAALGPAPVPAPSGEEEQVAEGAIRERRAKETDISSLPPDVIAMVGKTLAGELARWRDAWNTGRSSKSFLVVEAGLAVTVEFVLMNSVLDINKIVEPLKTNGMLEMREISGRQRPLHQLVFQQGADPAHCYILKRAFLLRCGFTLD